MGVTKTFFQKRKKYSTMFFTYTIGHVLMSKVSGFQNYILLSQ
jgi:hypothetical protein